MYTIIDTVSNSPVFNVMAPDGQEALLKVVEVRGLRADYEISLDGDEWIMTNPWGSKFVAVKQE